MISFGMGHTSALQRLVSREESAIQVILIFTLCLFYYVYNQSVTYNVVKETAHTHFVCSVFKVNKDLL